MTEEEYKWHRLNKWYLFTDEIASLRDVAINHYDPVARERAVHNLELALAPKAKKKKKKATIEPWLRWTVWERDDFRCVFCGDRHFLEVDHIIPETFGGSTALVNLQTLCQTCNRRKGTNPGKLVSMEQFRPGLFPEGSYIFEPERD